VRSGGTVVVADRTPGRIVPVAAGREVCSAGSADCRSWAQCVGVAGSLRSVVTLGGGMI